VAVFGAAKFERFFEAAAGLDVDRRDVRRFQDFAHRKVYDLLLIGQISAGANGHDLVLVQDLPITRGLQENIRFFHRMGHEIELKPVLAQLSEYPPLTRGLAGETRDRLPAVAGGLGVALARTFTAIDQRVTNPRNCDWERAARLFDLLL